MMEWLMGGWNSFETANIFRLLIASFLCGLVGIEREVHGRAAGFRTHLLVGVAACLMMIVSEYFFKRYGGLSGAMAVRTDPARIAAQIVVGIGFLGAGVIIKSGRMVRGLTTAACLWMAAGIGMAVGAGLYAPAVMVTLIAMFNLVFLKQIERLVKRDHFCTLIIQVSNSGENHKTFLNIIRDNKMRIATQKIEKDIFTANSRYEYVISTNREFDQESFIGTFLGLPEIYKVSIY
jgi:putative Mg2+ transporter-C (MgtC) family protein